MPVQRLGFDRGRELSEGVAAAGRALSAVAAADVGGDVGADEGEHGGERDGGDTGPGCGGGPGGHGRDHVVHEEQRPGFLPGQGGRPAAQFAAGAADGFLQMQEGGFQAMVLEELFPAPVLVVPPSEIERFRDRHSALLPEFRRNVERRVDEIFNLDTAWQRRRALDRLASEFKQATREVGAYMAESRFGKVTRSPWTALVGIIPGLDQITTVARAAADVGDPAPASPKSVLAYAAFASVELSRRQRRPREVNEGNRSLIGAALG